MACWNAKFIEDADAAQSTSVHFVTTRATFQLIQKRRINGVNGNRCCVRIIHPCLGRNRQYDNGRSAHLDPVVPVVPADPADPIDVVAPEPSR